MLLRRKDKFGVATFLKDASNLHKKIMKNVQTKDVKILEGILNDLKALDYNARVIKKKFEIEPELNKTDKFQQQVFLDKVNQLQDTLKKVKDLEKMIQDFKNVKIAEFEELD